jgi:exosortase B
MSTVPVARAATAWPGPAAVWVVLIGLAALVLPSYWDAAHGVWLSDEMSHGPIVLGVVIWGFWRARSRMADSAGAPSILIGGGLFGLGLLLYVLARIFVVGSVEFASQVLVVVGLLLALWGRATLRAGWFPVAYMLFLVPLPASFVNSATGPLKHWISVIVVDALHAFGYPIARSGVTISIGPYQLLVADACSGLNSMFGLAAIGALYMFVMQRRGVLHNAVMLLSILPIAFAANIVRVACLVLITYKLGDEAGQGFMHGAAGLMLFLVALGMLMALDFALLSVLRGNADSRLALENASDRQTQGAEPPASRQL